MSLNCLDFLSGSPKNFIFNKSSNKTLFGGILSLVFLILAFIIIIFYLLNFFLEDDFSVQYSYYQMPLNNDNEEEKKLNDERYNPYFNFQFSLFVKYKDIDNITIIKHLSENYIITNTTNGQIIPREKYLNLKVQDIDITLIYKCENENCEIDEEKNKIEDFIFYSNYSGFVLDHQNKTCPFYRDDEKYILEKFIFNYKIAQRFKENWKVTKYKKEEGLSKFTNKIKKMDEDETKIIGLTSYERENEALKNYYDNLIIFKDNTYYRILGQLKFNINLNFYEEYSRTHKSIWSAIASICSLVLTVFNGFSVALSKFYTSSFDNYKIIEKILFNKIDKKDKIKLSTDSNKEKLLPDSINGENIINNEENDIEDNNKLNNDEITTNKKLPKLRFFDFIFNYIYNFKPCDINRQKIISKCNEILAEYYSVDKILYSQLILENLFRDYKWNDTGLSKIDNSELIIQLKNLIDNYKNT